MANLNFFKVLISNIGCAFCKKKKCALRYYPEREIQVGTYYSTCQKNFDKRFKNALKRRLP